MIVESSDHVQSEDYILQKIRMYTHGYVTRAQVYVHLTLIFSHEHVRTTIHFYRTYLTVIKMKVKRVDVPSTYTS